jgi:O-methyltransferase domain/Dimerisation domain
MPAEETMSEQTPQSLEQLPPSAQMFQYIISLMVPQAIHIGAKLGIADMVAKAPATVEELAAATGSNAPSLRRLLKFLTSLGIFSEDGSEKYHQTPLSDTLRGDHPQSARGTAILFGSGFLWKSFGELATTIATGQPAFNHVFGTSFFEYLSAHREDAAIFNKGMTSISSMELPLIIAAYDFSVFERIVDVGGGAGALLDGILSANLKARGVLFDLPSVVKGADSLRTGSLAARCEIVGGDMFQSIPEGADAYLMRVVLHDWNDEDAMKILKNCRRAIPAHGKLLLVESVLNPSNQPDPGRFNDIAMLVLGGGRERTEVEFRDLLRKAGFTLTRVIPATGVTSIVEAHPV